MSRATATTRILTAAALIVAGLAIAAQPVKAQMFDPSAQQQQVILPQDDTASAEQQACIGAVVNGVCEGTAAPDAQTATCYGQMVGGVCAGSFQRN